MNYIDLHVHSSASDGSFTPGEVVELAKNAVLPENDIYDNLYNVYLSLVEKESLKDNHSRDIILSNLKNASRVSDAYIASSLKKPSNVVEGWIDALFLQKGVIRCK